MAKRKLDSPAQPGNALPNKRLKVQGPTATSAEQPSTSRAATMDDHPVPGLAGPTPSAPLPKGKRPQNRAGEKAKVVSRPAHKVRKLDPPRPFPSVPTSVSATGPRSAHTEGKNYICITRRTELGAYLRRCKDVFLKDGHKTLHLSAMGAAIPHLMQLALSLPSILPYPQDEIHTEILTGTVEVQDELIPEDEDEDVSYRTRGKSSVSIVIKVGDGVDEPTAGMSKGAARKNNLGRAPAVASGRAAGGARTGAHVTEEVVYREEDMDET